MKESMDNFLTLLYYERFKLTEKEKRLMEIRSDDTNLTIRNDQSISETRQQSKMIEKFISEYLLKLKREY